MTISNIVASEFIRRDAFFQLQRILTDSDERFLLKTPISNLDDEEFILEREFQRFTTLASPCVLTPVRLERVHGCLSAYYRNFEGDVLEVAREAHAWPQFADLLRGLSLVLATFHRHRSVLVGFTPDSFLRRRQDGHMLLTDAPFAQATEGLVARGEHAWLGSPFLPYLAPEVVDGSGRHVDQRADLYSLGVVLHQLVSGRLPFDSRDPAELIQCHLAKQPPSLLELVPKAPPAMARMLSQLLAKAPNDRFEDLDSLEGELARQLAAANVTKTFAWTKSASATPVLSEKLYGRADLVNQIAEQVRQSATTRIVIVLEGDAGIGKTSLLLKIKELARPALCCRGKFDQSEPIVPLSGWVGALAELARTILTKPAADLESKRREILDVVGEGAGLIAALVPEWNAILRCKAPSEDAPEWKLNRLALAIQRLLRWYADSSQPVTLMLDDLQWADPSSLRILELVLALPDLPSLLVVAATRPLEDAGTREKLSQLCASLESSSIQVEWLKLPRWTHKDLSTFCDDSFEGRLNNTDELVELILSRTDGNPFFVREFLAALIERRVVAFSAEQGTWGWDRQATRSLPPAESVVGLLSAKIQALPAAVKEALRVAACLGPTFRVGDLCSVTTLKPSAAVAMLEAAVGAGVTRELGVGGDLLDSNSDTQYEFAHDRILEACRLLSTDIERAQLCLEIARALSQHGRDDETADVTYRVAGYFNAAVAVVDDRDERFACAERNLKAGRLAKQRGAFSQALAYLESGLEFVEPLQSWQLRFELTYALHEEAAEAALLNGQQEQARSLADVALGRADTAMRKVFAYDVKIQSFSADKNFAAAAATALEILRDLDVTFPSRPSMLHVIAGYIAGKRRLFKQPVTELVKLPTMQDRKTKAVTRIIQSVYSAAYLSQPTLFPLLVYRQIKDTLKHGNNEYSGVAYNGFAVVLAGMGEIERATQLGQMGLSLLDDFQSDRLKAKLFMGHYTFVFPWKNHIRDTIPHYLEGLRSGLEHGDFEYSCFLMTLISLARLHTGVALGELFEEFQEYRAKITALSQERSIILQDLLVQLVNDLRDTSGKGAVLHGPVYEESEALPRCSNPIDHNLIFHNHLAKLVLGVFLALPDVALSAAAAGRKHLDSGAFAHYLGPTFLYYEAIAFFSFLPRELRNTQLRRIKRSAKQLKRAAVRAPMNFENKLYLVQAELARAGGNNHLAAQKFEKAIELAQEHGFVHEAGLAQERAAAFYLEQGMQRTGRHLLRECHHSYRRWGAQGATRRLELQYPQQFALLLVEGGASGVHGAARLAESLDYRLLLKSSQAISGEILLPQLVKRLLKTMIEHAAAQRGLLILERGGSLTIEAEADVDSGNVEFTSNELVEESPRLCQGVVHYAARTEKPVVLMDATREGPFRDDTYVQLRKPKSVLCAPILYQGKLIGLAYLENNRMSHVFTEARIEIVKLLAGQAAISITNALFHTLQLEAQQAKINPHFLFNALSSIAEMTVTDGPSAETAILRLAKLYRYVLDGAVQELVTLEQELEVVRHYLELEQLRFGSHLVFSVTSDGDVRSVRLPGLSIQPLVENSIRHGITSTLRPGNVWVHASVGDSTCSIVVQDDGDGSKPSKSGTGFGLRSVQERLALVFGKDYTFAISRPGGYRVEIEIPLARSGQGAAARPGSLQPQPYQSIENS
jgi:predicted ATPase/GAF domain-containing protein